MYHKLALERTNGRYTGMGQVDLPGKGSGLVKKILHPAVLCETEIWRLDTQASGALEFIRLIQDSIFFLEKSGSKIMLRRFFGIFLPPILFVHLKGFLHIVAAKFHTKIIQL